MVRSCPASPYILHLNMDSGRAKGPLFLQGPLFPCITMLPVPTTMPKLLTAPFAEGTFPLPIEEGETEMMLPISNAQEKPQVAGTEIEIKKRNV